MDNHLLPPVLTRRRIWLACGVAVATDCLQLAGGMLVGPGWFLDAGVDVVAMVLQTLLLGFHPLFLPTFVMKALPGVEMLPTWTGCTLLVIGLRRKHHTAVPPPVPPPAQPIAHDVIDV
jgi:hypothetical protein